MKKIADTGVLVAAADPHDEHHRWAAAALRTEGPFYTCEAVILETAWVLGSPLGVLSLRARGDLILDPAFDFSAEIPKLLELCRKYADRSIDLADACLVRMTELTTRCKIWTVDRDDSRPTAGTADRRSRASSRPIAGTGSDSRPMARKIAVTATRRHGHRALPA